MRVKDVQTAKQPLSQVAQVRSAVAVKECNTSSSAFAFLTTPRHMRIDGMVDGEDLVEFRTGEGCRRSVTKAKEVGEAEAALEETQSRKQRR